MSTTAIRKKKRIQSRHQGIANVLALALIPLSGFATDIYLPSLPGMAAAMHVSGLQVQFTITLFLVSYGISQLFIGGILDSYGRYNISLASLLLFALASVAIASTHNIYVIYGARIIHGITVGAIVAGKRAYFVDLFTGDRLKNYLSLFSIIWSTGPIVAPFVGGYLQTAFGWEANFYMLAIVAVGFAVLEFIFSGETLAQPTALRLKRIVTIYSSMLKTVPFILGIALLGLAYVMVMVYNMTGPFIVEHHLGFSPVVAGYCSLILGGAWMVGGVISKATMDRPFIKRLVVNTSLQVLFVLAMLASVRFADNLYTLVGFAFVIHVCAGYIFNIYLTFCMTRFPRNAGIASGLTGGLTYVIVSAISYAIVNILPAKDELTLGYSYLIVVLLSTLVMFLVSKKNAKESNEMALPDAA